jgi:hypothetical protein
MRLLDRLAHSQTPLVLSLDGSLHRQFEVTGSKDFASLITECPLRFVLADDLTRASAELAFADGARLTDCLDLLRMPAPLMWVEWNDEVHNRVIHETGSAAAFDPAASGRKAGVLLRSDKSGSRAVLRTFWSEGPREDAEVVVSPLETHLDLRGGFPGAADSATMLSGGFGRITDGLDRSMSILLDHVRFRFDDRWLAYYRTAASDSHAQHDVVHRSLAAVARDTPFLLGFLLLLTAKDATRTIAISRDLINRKRLAHGRQALLNHIEVSACLEAIDKADRTGAGLIGRRSPRLHHVRGHLVRRADKVFWRIPHLRGNASRGLVRSRTVCLSYATHS